MLCKLPDSCSFNVLKGLTTRGAVIGGVVGLVTAVVLIVLSKAVWVDTLKISDTPVNPFNGPALFAMPLSFLCCWFFSVTDNSARAKKSVLHSMPNTFVQ